MAQFSTVLALTCMSKALSSISAPHIPHACNPGAGEVGAGGLEVHRHP